MANMWLRLWHDMPTDPKFRTIARASGEPLALVISMFTLMLVDASRNVTRGHINVTHEDLASALDVTEAQIAAIWTAMKGRLLKDGELLGWAKRQPKREDDGDEYSGAKSAAQRKKEQRERQIQSVGQSENTANSEGVTQCHAMSRNVTLDKDKDKDKDKEEEHTQESRSAPTMAGAVCVALKVEGVGDVNPGNLNLKALIDAGADVGTFVAAARDVKDSGNKRFAYVLGIVRRQMATAADLAGQALAKPHSAAAIAHSPESFSERERRHKREQWEDMTGRKWDGENPPAAPADVIDITPTRIAQ